MRGSGRVFSGFGILPKYDAGIGKTINILRGSGIWLFPGNRDSPKIGHGMRDLCLCVCREWRKPSRPTGSSGQSKSTRRAVSGVSRPWHICNCGTHKTALSSKTYTVLNELLNGLFVFLVKIIRWAFWKLFGDWTTSGWRLFCSLRPLCLMR